MRVRSSRADPPAALQSQVKVEYLEYLRSRSMDGLHTFLYTFVNRLVKQRREAEAAAAAEVESVL